MRTVQAVAVATLLVAALGASWVPSPAQAQNAPSRACADEREAQKRASDQINRLGREMGRAGDPTAREALMEQIRRVMGERRAADQRLHACMREDQRQRIEEQRRQQGERRTPRPPGPTDLPEQRPQEGPPPPPGRSPTQAKPPSG